MKTLSAFLLVVSFATSAFAQQKPVSGSVEYAHYVVDSDATPEVHVYLRGPIRDKFGWTTWTLNNGQWSEALFGLTFAPTGWMEVTGSVGLERDDSPQRFGSSLWLGKGRVSLLAIGEKGGSGSWHKETLVVQTNERLGLGILDQKFFGTGPYVELKVKKVTTWGAIVGKRSGGFGVVLNF